jgi:hypothetical protein
MSSLLPTSVQHLEWSGRAPGLLPFPPLPSQLSFPVVCQRAPAVSSISNHGNRDSRDANKSRVPQTGAIIFLVNSRTRSPGEVTFHISSLILTVLLVD